MQIQRCLRSHIVPLRRPWKMMDLLVALQKLCDLIGRRAGSVYRKTSFNKHESSNSKSKSGIGNGIGSRSHPQNKLLILLGIEAEDNRDDIDWLAGKITWLRIFGDEQKLWLALGDVNGDAIIVSQFTLHGSVKKAIDPHYKGSTSLYCWATLWGIY